MWPLRSCFAARDFELEPIAFLEMMDAPVERQQEFEAVVGRTPIHIIRGYDNTTGNELDGERGFPGME